MSALNLEALGEEVRVGVSLELLWRLRDGQVYDEAGRFALTDALVEGMMPSQWRIDDHVVSKG